MPEPHAGPRFSLLYVSRMVAPDAGAVAEICRQSQHNNAREGITGLLVFDGAAFCQLVEGPEAALSGLLHRLEGDRRHADMRLLHFGRAPTRRFPSWRLGYAFVAGPGAIERVQNARGDRAFQAFVEAMGGLTPSDGPPD
jgi:hypothetical protein